VSVCDKCSSSDKTAEITAVPISSSASAATTGYGCKNSILPLVSPLCVWRGLCVVVRVEFKMKHPVVLFSPKDTLWIMSLNTFLSITSWHRIRIEMFIVAKLVNITLWNPKVHCRVHKKPPLNPVLSQINPLHTFTSSFYQILFSRLVIRTFTFISPDVKSSFQDSRLI
jgi:hypothetical protein